VQLIAEAYDILKTVGGLTNEELAATFAEWNAGEWRSCRQCHGVQRPMASPPLLSPSSILVASS